MSAAVAIALPAFCAPPRAFSAADEIALPAFWAPPRAAATGPFEEVDRFERLERLLDRARLVEALRDRALLVEALPDRALLVEALPDRALLVEARAADFGAEPLPDELARRLGVVCFEDFELLWAIETPP